MEELDDFNITCVEWDLFPDNYFLDSNLAEKFEVLTEKSFKRVREQKYNKKYNKQLNCLKRIPIMVKTKKMINKRF